MTACGRRRRRAATAARGRATRQRRCRLRRLRQRVGAAEQCAEAVVAGRIGRDAETDRLAVRIGACQCDRLRRDAGLAWIAHAVVVGVEVDAAGDRAGGAFAEQVAGRCDAGAERDAADR